MGPGADRAVAQGHGLGVEGFFPFVAGVAVPPADARVAHAWDGKPCVGVVDRVDRGDGAAAGNGQFHGVGVRGVDGVFGGEVVAVDQGPHPGARFGAIARVSGGGSVGQDVALGIHAGEVAVVAAAFVALGVGHQALMDTAELGVVGHLPGGAPRGPQGRKQDADEQGDNGDDDDKANEREAAAGRGAGVWHG